MSYKKIKVKLSMNIIMSPGGDIFLKSGLGKIEKEAEVMRYYPVDFIREVRKQNESQMSK